MDILDRDLLFQNVDGDAELLREIVDLFYESSREIVGNLRQAVSSQDGDEVNRTAHQLKGALANVGAEAAAAAAGALESAGRTGETTVFPDAFVKLESELERLQPELNEFVESLE